MTQSPANLPRERVAFSEKSRFFFWIHRYSHAAHSWITQTLMTNSPGRGRFNQFTEFAFPGLILAEDAADDEPDCHDRSGTKMKN
jgi:hypothetical protein